MVVFHFLIIKVYFFMVLLFFLFKNYIPIVMRCSLNIGLPLVCLAILNLVISFFLDLKNDVINKLPVIMNC